MTQFSEKPQAKKGWINGGFFVFKKIFEYLDNSNVMLETKPIKKLLKENYYSIQTLGILAMYGYS